MKVFKNYARYPFKYGFMINASNNLPVLGEIIDVNGELVKVEGIEEYMTNPPQPTGFIYCRVC